VNEFLFGTISFHLLTLVNCISQHEPTMSNTSHLLLIEYFTFNEQYFTSTPLISHS